MCRWGKVILQDASYGVSNLLGYANEGTKFLFGALASDPLGQNFAIQALPVIIFFAAFISILYYLGIMQYVIRWIGGGLAENHGHFQGRKPVRSIKHLCRPIRIAVGNPALFGRHLISRNCSA